MHAELDKDKDGKLLESEVWDSILEEGAEDSEEAPEVIWAQHKDFSRSRSIEQYLIIPHNVYVRYIILCYIMFCRELIQTSLLEIERFSQFRLRMTIS